MITIHTKFHTAITPKFELGRDFCTVHLPSSFMILCLYVRKSPCCQTSPQIHKQTDSAENIQRSSLRYDVWYNQIKNANVEIR